MLQQQQQPTDDADIGEHAILHPDPHRTIDFPEAQQQGRRHDSKNEQQNDADRGIPVEPGFPR